METIKIQARMTQTGEIEFDLPEGIYPSEVKSVELTLEIEKASDTLSWEERPWTNEEIQQMMTQREPKIGAEIAAMIESGELKTTTWAKMEIDNVVEWVKQLRSSPFENWQDL